MFYFTSIQENLNNIIYDIIQIFSKFYYFSLSLTFISSFFILFFTFFPFIPTPSPSLFVTMFFNNIFLRVSSRKSAINVQYLATDIFPVSSDTTTAIASVSFDIPIAALCLVPNSFAMS